jgi:uncharacterized protein DUF4145
MLVECPRCESDVDAKILGTHDLDDAEGPPWRLTLAECPLCGQPLLGSQEMIQAAEDGQWDWSGAEALWPIPELRPHADVADAVRECLEEAHKCFKAKAYFASEVMIVRALEAVCGEQAGESSLDRGFRALADQGVIDGRLLEWGELLLENRGRGGTHRANAQDAKDLMEFAQVLCEHVYVLSKKYTQYRERHGLGPQRTTKRTPVLEPPRAAAPEAPPSESHPDHGDGPEHSEPSAAIG